MHVLLQASWRFAGKHQFINKLMSRKQVNKWLDKYFHDTKPLNDVTSTDLRDEPLSMPLH